MNNTPGPSVPVRCGLDRICNFRSIEITVTIIYTLTLLLNVMHQPIMDELPVTRGNYSLILHVVGVTDSNCAISNMPESTVWRTMQF